MRHMILFSRFLITLFFLILLIPGCSGGKYTIIRGTIRHSRNTISGSYQKFDGEYFKTLHLETGWELTISIEADTDKGSLSLVLVDPYANAFVTQSFSEERKTRELVADQAGRYKIKIVGENHQGNFSVQWTVQEE